MWMKDNHLLTSVIIIFRVMLSSAHTSMNFLLAVPREHIKKH